jgi:hypothetical protein
MHAVREVNVKKSPLAKHYLISFCHSTKGMGCGVIKEIRFSFDDYSGKDLSSHPTDKDHPKKVFGDGTGLTGVERARKFLH